jgi:hypothetical protein
MPRRKSMSSTAPKGVDAYFSESDDTSAQNTSATPGAAPTPVAAGESIKTTVYITPAQRDYIDGVRYKLRNRLPGLTRSAVIRLALETLAQIDEEHVSAELLRHPDGTMA